MDLKGSWDERLPLIEFLYDNSHHLTIEMALFEALYSQKCLSPICWPKVGEAKFLGPKLVQLTI